ncbi:hypothetical protein GCM10028857_14570 [Salinarchaeum chitinilyticum]
MTEGNDPDAADASTEYPATLRFTLATSDEQFDAAIADAEAADSGESVGDEAVRAFDSIADLRELLTDRRLEALRSIHADPPASISALATRLDRPYAVVHEDVQTLARHGVVQFGDGPRGAKRPYVPYESVRVDVPLVGGTDVPDSLGLRS